MTTKILVTATTFPRCENDSSPRFVSDLSEALMKSEGIVPIVLVPHFKGTKTFEKINGAVLVYRYRYFFDALEKISGNGIINTIQNNKLLSLLIPFLIFFQFFKAFFLIRKYDVNIILANWIVPQGLVGVLIKKVLPKIKLIVISHGGDAALLNKNKFFKILGKYILNNCDVVVPVSNFIKGKIFDTGYNSDKICVIPMGVDVKKFSMSVNSVGYKGNKDKILFVGRLVKKKGVEYLIQSISILRNKFDMNIQAIIVGDGREKKRLERLVVDLDLQDNIEFVGALRHADILNYYANCEIFVVPSINSEEDYEGMPTVIFEAMSSRIPIITTDAGGIKDVISDRETGLLVNQNDPEDLAKKIIELKNDKYLRNFLVKMASKKVRLYSYSNIAKKYAEIIRKVKHEKY